MSRAGEEMRQFKCNFCQYRAILTKESTEAVEAFARELGWVEVGSRWKCNRCLEKESAGEKERKVV